MMRLRDALTVVGILFAPGALAGSTGLADQSAATSPLDRWSPFIVEASRRFNIPECWIRAVVRAESGGQALLDGQPITSRAGAMGLMQLMPETWVELRGRLGLGVDAYDPHDNILAGTAYLRSLYERYGYPGLFAAYNAGSARLDDHLFGGRPLPHETLAYLVTLGQPAFGPDRTLVVRSGNNLFFALHGAPEPPSNMPPMLPSGGLLVSLSNAPEQPP
jgi:soluble lytic murein transglycosylase-like protein